MTVDALVVELMHPKKPRQICGPSPSSSHTLYSSSSHTLYPSPSHAVTPRFFRSAEQLRSWFAKHGTTTTELWIGYYKKHTGKGGLTYKPALDEALCVGWIDGVIKSIDADRYMQRWTPRKPTSNWSNVNVKRVGELTAEGRMTPPGLAAFARRDPARTGVYSFENDPLELSPAFIKRFKADKGAWAYWSEQPPGYRRTVTGWVMTAKQEATRERRFERLIAHCAALERIPQFGVTPKGRRVNR
jgi:uncharacterized protein YdeI (YjbR/CyaY-like superfamily)